MLMCRGARQSQQSQRLLHRSLPLDEVVDMLRKVWIGRPTALRVALHSMRQAMSAVS